MSLFLRNGENGILLKTRGSILGDNIFWEKSEQEPEIKGNEHNEHIFEIVKEFSEGNLICDVRTAKE